MGFEGIPVHVHKCVHGKTSSIGMDCRELVKVFPKKSRSAPVYKHMSFRILQA
jgi:hypothetical protein